MTSAIASFRFGDSSCPTISRCALVNVPSFSIIFTRSRCLISRQYGEVSSSLREPVNIKSYYS